MMNIRSIFTELNRYEDIITELTAAIADPLNAHIVGMLRRHLDDAKQHCEMLRRQIRQRHEAFINSIDFEDGDTQPMIPVHVDTSAERHAEMRRLHIDADGGVE